MYKDKIVAVVVPAYNEERLIGMTLDSIPEFVDHIVVVDDCSQDETSDCVCHHATFHNGRVTLLQNEANQSVGGSIAAGYKCCRDQELDVAVIGLGAMGRNHARIYGDIPSAQLVGVADTDTEMAADIARRYGGQVYANYRQMLDEQRPDAVTVAVPTIDHLEVALEVIERGIHLPIEKPIAFSVEEGQQLIDAADEAGINRCAKFI